MYKLGYFANVKTIDNQTVRLEIEQDMGENVALIPQELLLADDAIKIDFNSDNDLFKPLKMSGGTITIYTKNVLYPLYSETLLKNRIKIYRDEQLLWVGFVEPNIYSSEYNSDLDKYELECTDIFSVMKKIQYKKDKDGYKLKSFIQILTDALDKVDKDKICRFIFFQDHLQIDSENDNLLEKCYIQDGTFFDEKGEPQNLQSIIEDIFLYLGVSGIQWRNNIYIGDYQALKDNNYKYCYRKYDRINKTWSNVGEVTDIRNIKQIGINETAGSLNMGDIFNSVSIVASINEQKTEIPNPLNEKDLINQSPNPQNTFEGRTVIKNDGQERDRYLGFIPQGKEDEYTDYSHITAYLKSKGDWKNLQKKGYEDVIEVMPPDIRDEHGCIWEKFAEYDNKDGEPVNLNYQTNMVFWYKDTGDIMNNTTEWAGNEPYLTAINTQQQIYRGGNFIINMEFELSPENTTAANCFRKIIDNGAENNNKYYDNNQYDRFEIKLPTYPPQTIYLSRMRTWSSNILFPVRLKIGEYYYNGDEWLKYSDYEKKLNSGYYRLCHRKLGQRKEDIKWWYQVRYTPTDDYEFVDKPTYDAFAGDAKRKGYTDEWIYWFVRETDNVNIYVSEEYYRECEAKDKFYLITEVKKDEEIFGSQKKTTNKVSWRMNLIPQNEGGALIKIPSYINVGNIDFQVFKPNVLGYYPQYDLDKKTTMCRSVCVSKFSFIYAIEGENQQIKKNENDNKDILYQNVINEDFVEKMDDITFRINTWNPKQISKSYVIYKKDNGTFDYVYNVKNKYNQRELKQEEHAIYKLVEHYSRPKIEYSNDLNDTALLPYTILQSDSLNKKMIIDSIAFNVLNNSAQVSLKEI